MQRHGLLVELPHGGMKTEACLREAFEAKYAATYGRGTAYHQANIELVVLRVEGAYQDSSPAVRPLAEAKQEEPHEAFTTSRAAYFPELGGFVDSPVYLGDRLLSGHVLKGPALIERMGDTALVPPGFVGRVDTFGNIVVTTENS
jgi:N-methylhydantoinase A